METTSPARSIDSPPPLARPHLAQAIAALSRAPARRPQPQSLLLSPAKRGSPTVSVRPRTAPARTSASTVESAKPTIRFDLKLELQPSENPWLELRRCAADFFQEVLLLDPHARLHPWDPAATAQGSSPLTPISAPARIQHYNDFKVYFHTRGGGPRDSGGPSHWSVNPELHLDEERFQSGIRWALAGKKHGLYRCVLQVTETVVLGWLLYSTSHLHAPTLAHHLSSAIGCPVGLRWRIIYTGSRFSKDTPKSTPVRALHIEASKPDAAKV